MNRIHNILGILLLIQATASFGQERQIDLGEVVVEGESIASSIVLRKESISGKYIIPRVDLVSFGYSTAGDVIKNLPLVYLDSDPGVNRNVSIGGLAREYQAILINGINPAGGEDSRDLKLDRIPVSMIERIEVDFNSPVSNGTGGIAGTVNIILKESSSSDGIKAHFATSINTTDPTAAGFKTDIEGSGKIGKINMVGGLSYNGYDRIKITELYDTTSDIRGGIKEQIVTGSTALRISANRPAGKYGSAKLTGFYSLFNEDELEIADVKRRKDGTLNVRESETANDKMRYLTMLDLNYRFKKRRDSFVAAAGYSNNYEKRHKDQLQEKSDYFEELREYEDQDNYSLNTELLYSRDTIQVGKTESQLNTGIRASYNYRSTDRVNASRPEGYLLWDLLDESYLLDESIISFFGDIKSNISDRLQIQSSLNFEISSGNFETADTSGSHNFSHMAPSIHINYKLATDIFIKAGLSRHISRPAFMSMVPIEKVKIKKDLIEVGNPDLVPAKSLAVNLSTTYFMNSSSYVTGSVYYKWVRDMIEMQYAGIDELTGYNLYRFVNIDTASLYGFYIDSRIDFNPERYSGFTLLMAYSYMGSRTQDDLTGGTKRVDGQPVHLFNIRVDYLDTGRKFNITTGLNYNSRRVISPFMSDDGIVIAETEEGGYCTLAARIKYFIGNRGSLYLAGDNLLTRPLIIAQGSVTEKSFPGAIIRFGVILNLLGS